MRILLTLAIDLSNRPHPQFASVPVAGYRPGTSELQAKVAAAQKAGQSISSRLGYGYASPGMGGGNAADDFYRSYMGRR